MEVGLVVAGAISVLLALGHMTIGLRWVLPGLSDAGAAPSPFGPPSVSTSMIRITWHVVTIFALGAGGILLTLAWVDAPDAKVVVLRWIGAMWIGATAMAFWTAGVRRDLKRIRRLPVPIAWAVIGVLCWIAAA